MLYDTEISHADEYVASMGAELRRYLDAAPADVAIIPSLPAYAANAWHDPAVENVTTAAQAMSATHGSRRPLAGASLYWWWEATPEDLRVWREALP
jgi:hypothetical protein